MVSAALCCMYGAGCFVAVDHDSIKSAQLWLRLLLIFLLLLPAQWSIIDPQRDIDECPAIRWIICHTFDLCGAAISSADMFWELQQDYTCELPTELQLNRFLRLPRHPRICLCRSRATCTTCCAACRGHVHTGRLRLQSLLGCLTKDFYLMCID